MAPTTQTPYWCFTLNNPGEHRVPYDRKIVQYVCYQLEEGVQKTPHFQGFVQFVDKKTTMKRAKEYLGGRYHLEPMKARDPMDAIRYTKKAEGRLDGPWEHGEFLMARSNKRKKSDMEEEYDADPRSFKLSLARSGWAYILPRGLADMTYQWARQGVQKNVVVDIERRVSSSHYDGIYSFIEMVKNRVISNTKYRSVVGFMRLDVHVVVVVTNVMFGDTKITRGRMCLHDLSGSSEV
ncbi:hypothetical protein BO79DRAFT_280827 [Aspergillus costaricaensis CBS 115574]|uniref:Uncharacterized protein n=1 Tax=Aspergillus costaricaensis CBS 115574 TaxID=1448317 RepID=A0ACD1ILZ2_9EURO|nr:hypothetical protein BO79DRAFT_280827 [Aspergillus costaricaensis CBS 115574]RAK90746.1 hypothetical protein BO79DRAFT_280827 [Aspergillus costaricaensis CBS 115574]